MTSLYNNTLLPKGEFLTPFFLDFLSLVFLSLVLPVLCLFRGGGTSLNRGEASTRSILFFKDTIVRCFLFLKVNSMMLSFSNSKQYDAFFF